MLAPASAPALLPPRSSSAHLSRGTTAPGSSMPKLPFSSWLSHCPPSSSFFVARALDAGRLQPASLAQKTPCFLNTIFLSPKMNHAMQRAQPEEQACWNTLKRAGTRCPRASFSCPTCQLERGMREPPRGPRILASNAPAGLVFRVQSRSPRASFSRLAAFQCPIPDPRSRSRFY